MRQSNMWSVALAEIPDPDDTHVVLGVLPAHASADPAAWARDLFSLGALPRWLAMPIGLRLLLTPGRPAWLDRFDVRRVEGDEALVAVDAHCLDVRVGVGVDEEHALVRVVAAIRLKGTHARFWTLPLRWATPHLLRQMVARSRRSMSGVTTR